MSAARRLTVEHEGRAVRVSGDSVEALKAAASTALGLTVESITRKLTLQDGGSLCSVNVTVDCDDELAAVPSDALLHATCSSAAPAAAAKPGGEHVASEVVGLGRSTGRFEYAEGRAAPNWFFQGYSSVSVHETMLRDEYRMRVYRSALEQNRHLIEGKSVLDVGCGTGVWACVCARLGAKRVVGIEASGMAKVATAIVAENGLSHVVTIAHDTVESIIQRGGFVDERGAPIRFDLIVSEWMGYFLLSEGVLPSVFRARDAWLAPGGVVFPTHCVMWLAPFADVDGVAFWDDVYGVKMGAVAAHCTPRDYHREFPCVESFPAAGVVGTQAAVRVVDCLRDTVASVCNFTTQFSCRATRTARWNGFVGSFTVYFDPATLLCPPAGGAAAVLETIERRAAVGARRAAAKELWLDACAAAAVTGAAPPAAPEDADAAAEGVESLTTLPYTTRDGDTHWRCTLLFVGDGRVEEGDEVVGTFSWTPNEHEPRYYNVAISYQLTRPPGSALPPQAGMRLWRKC